MTRQADPSVGPPFRHTQVWDDDTLVLRAGTAEVDRLRVTGDDPDFPGQWAFCVQAHPGASEADLLVGNDGQPWFRYGKFRVTTLAAVRSLAPDERRCLSESPVPENDYHCNVVGLTPEQFESILSRPPSVNTHRLVETPHHD